MSASDLGYDAPRGLVQRLDMAEREPREHTTRGLRGGPRGVRSNAKKSFGKESFIVDGNNSEV